MGRRARRITRHTSAAQPASGDETTPGLPAGLPPPLAPKMKLWVVLADQVQFGHGRAQLLRAIEELGSIRQAAAHFGMSYRRVWGYFQELEAAAGFPFLERRVGGWGQGGAGLTPEGRAFLTQYEAFQEQVDALVQQHFAAHFPTQR